MYILLMIFILFLTLFLNMSIFFINEEALIFLCLSIFFLCVYFYSNKFLRFAIFKKVEYIYLVFFYLLNNAYILLSIMEELFLNYLLFLSSFLNLNFSDFVYNKLFKFFSLERPYYFLINNYYNFKSILKLFILNKSSNKVNQLTLASKLSPSAELMLLVLSFERAVKKFLSQRRK